MMLSRVQNLVDKVLLVNHLPDRRVLLKHVTVFNNVKKFSLQSLLHLHEKVLSAQLYLQSLRLLMVTLIYHLFHILMCSILFPHLEIQTFYFEMSLQNLLYNKVYAILNVAEKSSYYAFFSNVCSENCGNPTQNQLLPTNDREPQIFLYYGIILVSIPPT